MSEANKMRIKEVLLNENDIRGIVLNLADRINNDYKNCRELVVLCVLKGAVVFTADLIRELHIEDVRLNFIKASSYGSSDVSCGDVVIISADILDIEGRNVLVVEDIIDTGRTLKALTEKLSKMNPKSLKVCGLFDKPERREVDFEGDYIGSEIPNKFIVGYGLDYGERYRNLPYVAVLEEHND